MNETKQNLRRKFAGLMKTYHGSSVKPNAIAIDSVEEFNALCDMIVNECAPPEFERIYLVTSAFGWAIGNTIPEAKKKCKENTPSGRSNRDLVFRAQLLHKDSKINGMTIEFPLGYGVPIQLGEV